MRSGVRTAAFRILLVEDDDDLRDTLVDALTLDGYSVRAAGDGVAALELIANQTFDCVVLDIGLPRLNGLEVARRLLERGFMGGVVAVSGFAREADRVAARAEGIEFYLVKPVPLPALQNAMAASVRHARRQSR